MHKKYRKTRNLIFCLMSLSLLVLLVYLWPWPLAGSLSPYILNLRLTKLAAYALVTIIAGLSTVSFQTITGNRFLTPSVLGLEQFYVLLQSTYFFLYWKFGQDQDPERRVEFLIVMGLLVIFFSLLQPLIGRLLTKGFGTILLICMSLGTLFRSYATFMQVLMDPNEYDKLQSKLFASFQKANSDILILVAALVLVVAFILYRKRAILDVFHLGKDHATLLGVAVEREQRQVLWLVVLLTAASTAMVGPMSFFGFLVTNLTYRLLEDGRHGSLFIITSLLGFVVLVIGQLVVERIFTYGITISMVVELCGGAYFFYLLYKERIRT